jgi:hypothetical protein
MDMRFIRILASIFILFLSAPWSAAAQDYPGYPYTIMTPEHHATRHHRVEGSKRTARAPAQEISRAPANRRHPHRNIAVARGSSGSVLPVPLPRTPLIPPEGGGAAVVRVAPPQQSPTAVPGLANPVPNLPHGAETFQDRAARCVMQQGLYGVPGGASTQYMSACLQ